MKSCPTCDVVAQLCADESQRQWRAEGNDPDEWGFMLSMQHMHELHIFTKLTGEDFYDEAERLFV